MEQNILLMVVGNKEEKRVNYCNGCMKIISSYGVNLCQSCSKIGIPRTKETREKISFAFSDEKHPAWKGDNVSYVGLHQWVKRNKPLIEKCEKCNQVKKLCLSNISGEYKRDINDYEWLCYLCHNRKDKDKYRIEKGVKIKNGNV